MKSYKRYRTKKFNSETEKLMTVKDYAKKVNLTQSSVREQCRLKKIKSFFQNGKWFIIVSKKK